MKSTRGVVMTGDMPGPGTYRPTPTRPVRRSALAAVPTAYPSLHLNRYGPTPRLGQTGRGDRRAPPTVGKRGCCRTTDSRRLLAAGLTWTVNVLLSFSRTTDSSRLLAAVPAAGSHSCSP